MESSKITQNTTYLTIASIFQKLLSFIYFAFLAKILGSEALGQYQAILSFTGIFIIFMDFGLGPVLTREAAKEEDKLANYFSLVFGLKLILIFLSVIGLVVTANILHYLKPLNYTTEDLFLIYVGGVIIILDTLVFTFFCVFRALKNLKYEAINVMIYQAIIFCLGLLGLIYTKSVLFLLIALITASLFSFIYFLVIIKKKTNIKFIGQYDFQAFKTLLKISAPFAIAGIFVRLNGTIDMQMLKYMLDNGNHYVGLYTLAFKLTFALTVLSGSFASSYFPSVSYYLKKDLKKVRLIFEKGVAYMMLLSLPITAGVLVLGDKIILTVWSESYQESILPLKLYILALVFIFLNYPIGNLLNAANKQALNTFNTGIALVVNLVLNYFLIPQYNIIGACISALASSIVLVILGFPWVYKILKFSWLNIFSRFIRLFFASAAMALCVYLARFYLENINLSDKILLLVLILIGAITYPVFTLLLKGLRKEEIKSFLQAFKK